MAATPTDVLAVAMQGASACVLLPAFRDGRNLGTRRLPQTTNGEDSAAEVAGCIAPHYYAEQLPPAEIVPTATSPNANRSSRRWLEHAGRGGRAAQQRAR